MLYASCIKSGIPLEWAEKQTVYTLSCVMAELAPKKAKRTKLNADNIGAFIRDE